MTSQEQIGEDDDRRALLKPIEDEVVIERAGKGDEVVNERGIKDEKEQGLKDVGTSGTE